MYQPYHAIIELGLQFIQRFYNHLLMHGKCRGAHHTKFSSSEFDEVISKEEEVIIINSTNPSSITIIISLYLFVCPNFPQKVMSLKGVFLM